MLAASHATQIFGPSRSQTQTGAGLQAIPISRGLGLCMRNLIGIKRKTSIYSASAAGVGAMDTGGEAALVDRATTDDGHINRQRP